MRGHGPELIGISALSTAGAAATVAAAAATVNRSRARDSGNYCLENASGSIAKVNSMPR